MSGPNAATSTPSPVEKAWVTLYFSHPESDDLWDVTTRDPEAAREDNLKDGLSVELSLEEYEQHVRQREHTKTKLEPAKPQRSAAPASGGLGLAPEPRAAPTKQPLHVRLRPRMFEEVIGQSCVLSLARLIRDSDSPPHLYLFTGPSGCGKTTLGRIVAKQFTNSPPTELDAATNGSVDDTRQIVEWAQYQQLDGSAKVLILDECHALSKAAWQALLKITEEPPAHVYIVLCTTEEHKVPATIRTRAAAYALKPIGAQTLAEYAQCVVEQERILLPEEAVRYIAAAADGSVRQLLMHLQVCAGATSLKQVQELLEQSTDSVEAIEVARAIVKGTNSYVGLHALLAATKKAGAEPEGVRIAIVEYLTAVMLNNTKPNLRLLPFLEALAEPVPARGGWARLVTNLAYACEEQS